MSKYINDNILFSLQSVYCAILLLNFVLLERLSEFIMCIMYQYFAIGKKTIKSTELYNIRGKITKESI